MKPVSFEYVRPASLGEAVGFLGGTADAKVLAGGQTLGPMLNLRLAQPALLVDITRIPELATVHGHADAITLGATITHAAIEDGRVPDPTGGFLGQVARGIAYHTDKNDPIATCAAAFMLGTKNQRGANATPSGGK
mgnify:CR=1 FL=1